MTRSSAVADPASTMIDAELDAIIVIAGSSTAPARVIADACAKGIAVINFDSLVDTKTRPRKINTDQQQWGEQAAELLVKQISGKGKILVLNGPAGISVSDDRRKGAEPVLKANPASRFWPRPTRPTTPRRPRRRSPACSSPIPQIDGILSLGRRALGRCGPRVRQAGPRARSDHRRELSPVPRAVEGEEADLLGDACSRTGSAASPSTPRCRRSQGKDVPAFVDVPLPIIDERNIDSYLARAKDFPADGYIYSPYDTSCSTS